MEADHQPPPEENGLHESNTILLRINLCDAFEFEKDNKMRVLREKKIVSLPCRLCRFPLVVHQRLPACGRPRRGGAT